MSGAVRVLHVLPDLAMGGGQMIVLNLVSTPVEGVEHAVVALGPGPMEEQFDRAGIAVEVLDTNGPLGWVRTVARVTARVRRERWDVVHTNNTPLDRTVGVAVAALARRPTVNTLMAVATSHAPRHPGEPLAAFARRRAGNLANRVLARGGTDRIIALSNTVRRAHAAALRVPPARIEVVYPGVPDTAFATPDAASLTALRDVLGLAHADPILISIGRLEPNKGQLDLVGVLGSVLERFPAAQLLLVGDGPDREPLERAFAAAGLTEHAQVLGRRSDVGELLALSDILVSTARLEGFGMAALEALAAGCPVAGYLNDHVALDEFVEHGRTGRLVPVDAAALADAVVTLAGDRDARPVIADRCRDAARSYSAAHSARRMATIYRSLTRSYPGHDPSPPPPPQPHAGSAQRRAAMAQLLGAGGPRGEGRVDRLRQRLAYRLDPRVDRYILERVVLPALVDLEDVHRVLFVGCEWYTRHYPHAYPGLSLRTIDIDPSKARYGSPDHIVGSVVDLEGLVAPQSFDAVVCSGVIGFGLQDAVDADRALRGCRSALRPGGWLVLGWNDVADLTPFDLDALPARRGFDAVAMAPFPSARYPTFSPSRHTFDFYRRPPDGVDPSCPTGTERR